MKDEAKRIKAVIFDLDGTLLDTLDDLRAAVCYALGVFGLGAIDKEHTRRFVGDGVQKLIERAVRYATTGDESDVEHMDKALVSAVLAVFTEYYDKHSADLTAPYAGVVELIEFVKASGIGSAIVTNKYDAAAKALCKKFFAQVDAVIGVRDGIRPKPSSDGVRAALEMFGADRSEAVYVGDGETDIATAKNSGLPIIAVTWGFRDRKTLERLAPDYIADSPEKIQDLLRQSFGTGMPV